MTFKFDKIIDSAEDEAMPDGVAIAVALEESGNQTTVHIWDDASLSPRLKEDAELRAAIVAAVQHRLNAIAGVI